MAYQFWTRPFSEHLQSKIDKHHNEKINLVMQDYPSDQKQLTNPVDLTKQEVIKKTDNSFEVK